MAYKTNYRKHRNDPSVEGVDFSKSWPGEVVSIGEPEPVGPFPIRQEVSVIQADEKKSLLGWKIYEYNGTEAFDLSRFFRDGGKIGDDLTVPEGGWGEDWGISGIVADGLKVEFPLPGILTGKVVIPLANRRGLQVGDWLIVGGLMGFDVARVTEVNGDKATAESDGCFWPLEFGKDDRGCWVCTLQISKAVMERVLRPAFVADIDKEVAK